MPPISGASCRQAGTAPERSKCSGGLDSVRSNPLAQGSSASRVRFRDVGQLKPEAPRSSMPHPRFREQRPAPRPSAGNDWQNGPCHPSVTARPRRGFAQPHPGSIRQPTPCGDSRRVLDPSIESVQPTCQRSVPGFRVGCRPRWKPRPAGVAFHAASPTFTRWVPVAPAFSSGVACARRMSGAPEPRRFDGLAATAFPRGPTPRCPCSPRDRRARAARTRSTFRRR